MKGTRLRAPLLGLLVIAVLCVGAWSQKVPEGPLTLKDASLGAVTFDHAAHLKVAGRCAVCHHASKPEKSLRSPQQACTDCHTKPATPPVTRNLQAAFHNPAATAGLCIDCHKTENSNGKAAPVKCADCHKKAGT